MLRLMGVSYRTAPLAVREALSFDDETAGALLRQAAAERTDFEGVILSTCNRTEIYLAADDPGAVDTHVATIAWGGRNNNLMIGGLGVVDGKVQSLKTGSSFHLARQQANPFGAELNTPRTQCQAVHHDGKLYVIGGVNFTPDADGGTTECFGRSDDHPAIPAAQIRP